MAFSAANRSEYAKLRKNLKKDWNAKRILETLEKANPQFYPTPNRQLVDGETGKVVSLENVKSGFLTKHDYMALFDTCSGILHAENPFSTKRDPNAFMNSVTAVNETRPQCVYEFGDGRCVTLSSVPLKRIDSCDMCSGRYSCTVTPAASVLETTSLSTYRPSPYLLASRM